MTIPFLHSYPTIIPFAFHRYQPITPFRCTQLRSDNPFLFLTSTRPHLPIYLTFSTFTGAQYHFSTRIRSQFPLPPLTDSHPHVSLTWYLCFHQVFIRSRGIFMTLFLSIIAVQYSLQALHLGTAQLALVPLTSTSLLKWWISNDVRRRGVFSNACSKKNPNPTHRTSQYHLHANHTKYSQLEELYLTLLSATVYPNTRSSATYYHSNDSEWSGTESVICAQLLNLYN